MNTQKIGKGIALGAGIVLPLAIFVGIILGPTLDPDYQPQQPPPPQVRIAVDLPLRFLTADDETLHIVQATLGDTLQTLPPGEGGFLRGALRPLERERARHGTALDAPYVLSRQRDGALVLRDPGTEFDVDVAAFGESSVVLFEALFSAGPNPLLPKPES